jgi:hypothetical protein
MDSFSETLGRRRGGELRRIAEGHGREGVKRAEFWVKIADIIRNYPFARVLS